jgi:hypothetical protein
MKKILNHKSKIINLQSLVMLLFLGILFINYFDVLKFKYYVPPGSDPVTHVSVTKEILEKGKAPAPGYPPGFHYIVAGLSKISGADPIKTMVYFYPFLMFLSALAVYLFARQFFGPAVAILSLILFGFLSPQPRQTLWDGGFPNVITADFIMILGFLFFLRAYKYEKWRDVVLAGIILGLVPFFHHLSSYLMTFLLICIAPSLLLFGFITKQNFKKKLQIVLTILVLAILIGAYPAYIYFGKGYLEQIALGFVAYAASWEKFVWRATTLVPEAPPIPWSDYALVVSPYLWYLGWLSLPFLLKKFLKEKKEEYFFVFVWLLVVFILSRPTVFSPLPGRFAREMAIPLVLCAGIFLKEIFLYFKDFWPRLILGILIGVFIIKGLLGLPGWVGKYNHMVFIRDLDKEALDWVKENTPKNATFAVAPFNRWFGLLAYRPSANINTDLSKIKNYDYLYINRWQKDWMWGEDPTRYIKIREEVKKRNDLQLIKNFGAKDEKGIAIYKIKK